MEPALRDVKGSPTRDAFKHWHKNLLPAGFYALDMDLLLVEKHPPGIVAALDVKQPGDKVRFSEVIAYNDLLAKGIPVYLIWTNPPRFSWFRVERYMGGDWRPDDCPYETEPVMEGDAEALVRWEAGLRRAWRLALREV